MKYIKLFEMFGDVVGFIFKPTSYKSPNGYSVENTIEDTYEFFYKLGLNPKVLKNPPGTIYFEFNKEARTKLPMFFINRSDEIRTGDSFEPEIDEEKEKDMELYLAAKKYNI